jgi:hypothetical protein
MLIEERRERVHLSLESLSLHVKKDKKPTKNGNKESGVDKLLQI